jgi:hypothetical protein
MFKKLQKSPLSLLSLSVGCSIISTEIRNRWEPAEPEDTE